MKDWLVHLPNLFGNSVFRVDHNQGSNQIYFKTPQFSTVLPDNSFDTMTVFYGSIGRAEYFYSINL